MRAPLTLEMMPDPAQRRVECVERKGKGHPDTICDAVSEAVSRALSRHYLERFGRILHHNVDKVLLAGGQSRPRFGGGELTRPIEIVIAGRATTRVGGDEVPVEAIALGAARECIRATIRGLDPERDIRWECRVRPGSIDLAKLFARGADRMPLANDTSAGAGFAPFTPLEAFVLASERMLSGSGRPHDACGEDVKIAAVRRDDAFDITVACAAIDATLDDADDYRRFRDTMSRAIEAQAGRILPAGPRAIAINAADDLEAGTFYLTVTGTSAEAGDDGETGRGNRASGLISVTRPQTMEAAAGKNPISHVGKLYNVLAQELAEEIMRDIAAVRAVECILASRVGVAIDRPVLAHLRVALAPDAALADLEPTLGHRLEAGLARLTSMWRRFLVGELRLF